MRHEPGFAPATLTLEEIERRLDTIASAVAAAARSDSPARHGGPMWIRPAELVRQVRPYLALN